MVRIGDPIREVVTSSQDWLTLQWQKGCKKYGLFIGQESGLQISRRDMNIDRSVPFEISVVVKALVLKQDRRRGPVLKRQMSLSSASGCKGVLDSWW